MTASVHLIQPTHDDETIPSIADLVPEDQLSDQTKMLIDYATRRGGRLPKSLTKKSIKDQFDTVFEMIGGVPRLAIWADENPSLFFSHYAKLLPLQAKVDLTLPPDPTNPQEMTTAQLRSLLMVKLAQQDQQDQQDQQGQQDD